MSRRLGALSVIAAAVLIAACNTTTVSTSTEPSPTAAPPTRSPSATSGGPSRSTRPSGAPFASPGASAAAFTSTVDNQWFPLVAGTKLTYEGTKDGKKAVETFTVTSTTRKINGIDCVVVEDVLSLAGVATEKVIGYYAQDQKGSVWSFGEDNQELDASGHVVSTEGSWRAGVDKAPPALIMEGAPAVGHSFEHDVTKNDFAVISLASAVKVPDGTFDNALVTKEWSPLEPDIETHKFYVPGVGVVRDVAVKGPTEELLLVKVEHG